MRFIDPTKPVRSGEGILDEIGDEYLVETKYDGWRAIVSMNEGNIKVVSRHNKPMDMPNFLLDKLQELIPEGSMIDCEWINQTRIKGINEQFNLGIPLVDCISVFDVLRYKGKSLKSMPLQDRRNVAIMTSLQENDLTSISDGIIFRASGTTGNNARQFYEDQKATPLSEGVVIKRLKGTLGATWYKVRHR